MSIKATVTKNYYPFNHERAIVEGDLCVVSNEMGKLCGYCELPAAEFPIEWHSDYSADALQYLNVHGGMTYASVGGGDQEARSAAEKLASEQDYGEGIERWSRRRAAIESAGKAVPYTVIIFGFDCAHHGDDCNSDLADVSHVMSLAAQMRQQLIAYRDRLPEWRAADRARRIQIIDEIIATAPLRCEIGFGALIGAMSGAKEFG